MASFVGVAVHLGFEVRGFEIVQQLPLAIVVVRLAAVQT
jgi:hypothetical protein